MKYPKMQLSTRLPLLQLLLSSTLSLTMAQLKLSYTIPDRQKECLYDILKAGEYATISTIILSGKTLQARATISGPFASETVTAGSEVYSLAQSFSKTSRKPRRGLSSISESYDVSYEEIYEDDMVDDMDDDDEVFHDDDFDFEDDMDDAMLKDYYYDFDDDDHVDFMVDDLMTPEEIQEATTKRKEWEGLNEEEREKKRQERKEVLRKEMEGILKERKEVKAKRQEQKEKEMREKNKIEKTEKKKTVENMQQGKLFQKTVKAQDPGWYMACIEAVQNEVTVEFEFRKGSDVGNISEKTGHLQSYERHQATVDEKKLLTRMNLLKNKEDNTIGPKEESIQESDLEMTRSQIQRLSRLLIELKEKQENERHRISVHKAINEHSHSRMVLSSLTETVIYIMVSGFQVYTIRKWFSGNPLLG